MILTKEYKHRTQTFANANPFPHHNPCFPIVAIGWFMSTFTVYNADGRPQIIRHRGLENMPHGRPWPLDKKRRFAEDWNNGMEIWLLKEKYATTNPYKMATNLKAAGFEIKARKGVNQ